MPATSTPLEESVERFSDQGYVILPNFLDPQVIADVRRDVQTVSDLHIRQLFSQGKITQTFDSEPFDTRLIRVYEECEDDIPTTFRSELHYAGMFGLFFHP